jgi:hypothetical protein
MAETLQLGEITIALTLKDIKHAHLSVHPVASAASLRCAQAFGLGGSREPGTRLAFRPMGPLAPRGRLRTLKD